MNRIIINGDHVEGIINLGHESLLKVSNHRDNAKMRRLITLTNDGACVPFSSDDKFIGVVKTIECVSHSDEYCKYIITLK